jgi:hypothetical protein
VQNVYRLLEKVIKKLTRKEYGMNCINYLFRRTTKTNKCLKQETYSSLALAM